MTTRLLLLLALSSLPACSSEQAPPPARKSDRVASGPAAKPPVPAPAPSQARSEAGGDAADALRNYYALVAAGDYERAARLRSDTDESAADRLAVNFAAYETYRTNIGAPSQPVERDGWRYVEVPVMITGSFKGGKPFASSGSVTMRSTASVAEGEEGDWRLFTGE